MTPGIVRTLFTNKVVAIYKQMTAPTSFLRSFFTVDEGMTKTVSIEVQRGSEKIAVDVIRGTKGNLNKFTRSTEKVFLPPFFYEKTYANETDLYDTAIGMQSAPAFAALAKEMAGNLFEMKSKIERSIEKMAADVFETGIITLVNGDSIDFKRKAGSLVDDSTYWGTGSVDPYAHLRKAAEFLRKTGKSSAQVFNVILGTEAYDAFLNNTIVKGRADIKSFEIDTITEPVRNSVGGTLVGRVSAGSYKFNLWVYGEFYDNASGVSTPYINPKKMVVLPEVTKFVLAFAAVTQLIQDDGIVSQKGAYLVSEYIDERDALHEINIKSAPITIPVAVDQIFTQKVVAG